MNKFLLRALKSRRSTDHHLVVNEIDNDLDKSLLCVNNISILPEYIEQGLFDVESSLAAKKCCC
jgi:hypothetical protein